MTVRELERLYDYGYWANRRLLAAVAQLTVAQFTQEVAGSYGSVRNTLVHILSAEWGWLDRCGGLPRGSALKPEDYPTPESLVARWAMVEQSVREFLATLTDADLERKIEFRLPGRDQAQVRRLGDLMQHGANHGVHHRGQVALLLRALGQIPGNVDMLIYDADPARTRAR
jgi:uncharacterized damage-inducible protein DinB